MGRRDYGGAGSCDSVMAFFVGHPFYRPHGTDPIRMRRRSISYYMRACCKRSAFVPLRHKVRTSPSPCNISSDKLTTTVVLFRLLQIFSYCRQHLYTCDSCSAPSVYKECAEVACLLVRMTIITPPCFVDHVAGCDATTTSQKHRHHIFNIFAEAAIY